MLQNRPHRQERLLVVTSSSSVITRRFGETIRSLTRNVGLTVEQGCKSFYCINLVSYYPLAATEEDLAMCGDFIFDILSVQC